MQGRAHKYQLPDPISTTKIRIGYVPSCDQATVTVGDDPRLCSRMESLPVFDFLSELLRRLTIVLPPVVTEGVYISFLFFVLLTCLVSPITQFFKEAIVMVLYCPRFGPNYPIHDACGH